MPVFVQLKVYLADDDDEAKEKNPGQSAKFVWVEFQDDQQHEFSSEDYYDDILDLLCKQLDMEITDPESQIECYRIREKLPDTVNRRDVIVHSPHQTTTTTTTTKKEDAKA